MAITVNPVATAPFPVEGNKWSVSVYSADLEGGEIIKAAEAGKCHYIKKLKIRTASATIITVGERVAATGALTNILLGPMPFLIASSTDFDIEFEEETALKVQEGYGLAIIQVGAGATWIWCEGKTGKAGTI